MLIKALQTVKRNHLALPFQDVVTNVCRFTTDLLG